MGIRGKRAETIWRNVLATEAHFLLVRHIGQPIILSGCVPGLSFDCPPTHDRGKGKPEPLPTWTILHLGNAFQAVVLPPLLRIDSPRISIRCALWTRRSRMPSANGGSPICSCQRETGSCEVRIVDSRGGGG